MKLKNFSALGAGLLILLAGCGGKPDNSAKEQRDVFAMDTYMSLTAYGGNAVNALDKATERITELESLLAVNSEESDVWRINHSGGNTVQVSDDTAEIIASAIEYGDSTGTLDITVYPVLREWGFTTGDYKIPADETLAELLEYVDYSAIQLDGNDITLPENYMIDLGAVAKGYTGDEVIAELKENGVESAIVSLGGNVQALGLKPDGSKWNVSVLNPFMPDSGMCIISVGEKAVITSGNYERYFTGEDGKNYWHIIDKADGYPADNGLVSVTIIGDSGIMCDALSTALFIAGTENAQEYWRRNGGFDMILVTDDGRILYTDGIADGFKNTSSMPAEVISVD
ncbi:MAG: FAD:protein FMN transferase [Ruminococcus flavefaciens]|nr:FAD:protein FMN transferase [Ruminococcus flavefaciens]MCM1230836.1 FAD:protein FMN transferase [Ruminococcus flavefaciens]